MQTRTIKALSDQQIADLKAGRGMGLALSAELNGYPGPIHVLELADQLGLSAEQKARIKDLFDSMKAEAVPLVPNCWSKRRPWISSSPTTRSLPKV